MKMIRQRKPSMKSALGITQAKKDFAKSTGLPTTGSGRKRKAMNTLTDGAYGEYQRTRAAVNRPIRATKSGTSGCFVYVLAAIVFVVIYFLIRS